MLTEPMTGHIADVNHAACDWRRRCPASLAVSVHAVQKCIQTTDIQIIKGTHVVVWQKHRAIYMGCLEARCTCIFFPANRGRHNHHHIMLRASQMQLISLVTPSHNNAKSSRPIARHGGSKSTICRCGMRVMLHSLLPCWWQMHVLQQMS